MQKRILPIAICAIFLISLIGWGCTKLDTTDIGSDLIPAVDNVHTFADTVPINSTQGFFNDSTYISKYDDHALGHISNDPLFGTTKASIFMQLKPTFYPYFYGNPRDTIVAFDSVVLCLKYRGFWGDSNIAVNLRVMEVNDYQFGVDSIYKENTTAYQPATGASLANPVNIDVRTLGKYVKFTNGRDSVNNQIRIQITNQAWLNAFFGRDSIKANASNNAFYSDSVFRRFYHGIAVIGGNGGNGLIYVSLADTGTKLEVHYRKKNGGPVDTTYSSLRLNPSMATVPVTKPEVSNSSNYILRNRAGFPVSNPASTEHYLQTSPGTFVNLNIPGLATMPNRIIHRAEIIIEQIPTDPDLDEKFIAPNFLYLELKDTTAVPRWKPIYYDLNTSELYDPDYRTAIPYLPGQIDFQYYGGYRKSKLDPLTGKFIKHYHFNITRYVQHIVTNHLHSYDMRLSAPNNLFYPQYSTTHIPYGNDIAFGRVRIGSGTNPNYRLRLRIVYSKL